MGNFSTNESTNWTRSVSWPVAIGDEAVLLLYSLALFITAGVHRLLEANTVDSLDALFEFNAGEILALSAIYSVLKSKTGAIALCPADFAVIACCALFMATPVSVHPAFLGAAIAGVYFILRRPGDARLAQVGQLWLAIACYESFGHLIFSIISEPLIQAELSLISKLGAHLGFQFHREGIRLVSPDGWFVYMMERCSSFHNISLAILVWLSLTKLAGMEVKSRQFGALATVVVSIVLLNALRILLMTPSQDAYDFWHDGAGTLIFSCATFFAVALPTALSLRRAA